MHSRDLVVLRSRRGHRRSLVDAIGGRSGSGPDPPPDWWLPGPHRHQGIGRHCL